MAAHSYWRVRMWKATGNVANAIRIAELEFILSGTGQLATPTQAISSGDYSSAYPKEEAIDGLKTSGVGWASTSNTNAWLGAYFATAVDLEAIKIYHPWQAEPVEQLCISGAIALEYSDNGSDWFEQSREALGTSLPSDTIVVGYNRLPGLSKQARYWRVTDLDNNGSSLQLSRVQLWSNNSRVCQNATLTSSNPPISGTIASLKTEGNDICEFQKSLGLGCPTLTWDAGSGNTMDVLVVRFAGPQDETFVKNFTLSYSDNNVDWTDMFVSQKYRLKFPGAYQLTKKADADKLIKPEIEAIGNLGSFLVDNNAQTVNLRYNDRPNMRAIIPIVNKVRSHFEVTLPATGDMRWYMALLQIDPTNTVQRGLYETGWNGAAAIYQRATGVGSFGVTLLGMNIPATDYNPGSVISFSIDSILGYFTVTTANSRVCFRNNKLKENNVFFVLSKDPESGYTNQEQDRIFSFNFGESPFTRQPPSNYWASAGNFYEFETTVNRVMIGCSTLIAKYTQYCGRGYIKNWVYSKGNPNTPVRKRLALFDAATNVFVAETISDTTGLYEFKFLDEKLKYIVMATDEKGFWEPACTGPITPSIMPLITV